MKGLENIKNIDGNFILASNHQHELDGFLLPATIPLSTYFPPIFPVSRESEFYYDKGIRGRLLYGGAFFKFMGAYPAYGGLNNYAKSLHNQVDILADNYSILIFPEEKVHNKKIKGGLGFLALKSNRPIVPVKIEGVYKMTIWEMISFKRDLTVTFMKPRQYTEQNHLGHIDPSACKKIAREIGEVITV